MMPNLVKQRGHGYSGGQATSSVQYNTREGDAVVVELFNHYTGPENNSGSWEFRKEAIKAAHRLFAGNGNWFIKQDMNPMVQDYNYLFLQDTLRFIGTGHRHMAIYAWQDILTHAPKEGRQELKARHELADAIRAMALDISIDALLQRWLSQPKGFDDLMFSLHLMFGRMDMRYDYQT